MDTLAKTLYAAVSQAVDCYAASIASKHDLSKEDLLELWNTGVSSELKVTETTSKPKEEKKAAPRTRKPAESKAADDSATCEYEFKKGANIGKTCTAKVCSDSAKFCRKHKAQEDKDESAAKTTAKKPATKAATASKAKKASETKEKESVSVKNLNANKSQLVIKKNSHGNYEHPETRFVLDKTTKVVFGKQTDSGVQDLTAEDIETCKKFNFKYELPKNLSSKEDVEEEEDNEEDEEDDEEEEDEVSEEEDDE
jgi:hypothetical protein